MWPFQMNRGDPLQRNIKSWIWTWWTYCVIKSCIDVRLVQKRCATAFCCELGSAVQVRSFERWILYIYIFFFYLKNVCQLYWCIASLFKHSWKISLTGGCNRIRTSKTCEQSSSDMLYNISSVSNAKVLCRLLRNHVYIIPMGVPAHVMVQLLRLHKDIHHSLDVIVTNQTLGGRTCLSE